MDSDLKIVGGFILTIFLLLTMVPVNDDVQQLALGANSTAMIRAIALIYPDFHAGMVFIVAALTLYEIFMQVER